MRLTHVVVASDLNPRYLDCWPLARRAWADVVGLQPILVLVANAADVPDSLKGKPDVHVIEPVEGLHISFQAQCVRLLYPALLETEGAVVIADVDMIPLNREYFHLPTGRVGANHVLAYRDVLLAGFEIPVCYVAAAPKIWGDLFEIGTVADVRDRLRTWGTGLVYDGLPGGHGWDTDQVILYRSLVARGRERRDVWILDDRFAGHHRLDGRHVASPLEEAVRNQIARGVYSDYHLLQPLDRHRDTNEEVLRTAIGSRGSM